jgi:hypothetical protein
MVLMPILPKNAGRIASPALPASAPCSLENAWPACGVGMLNSNVIKGPGPFIAPFIALFIWAVCRVVLGYK